MATAQGIATPADTRSVSTLPWTERLETRCGEVCTRLLSLAVMVRGDSIETLCGRVVRRYPTTPAVADCAGCSPVSCPLYMWRDVFRHPRTQLDSQTATVLLAVAAAVSNFGRWRVTLPELDLASTVSSGSVACVDVVTASGHCLVDPDASCHATPYLTANADDDVDGDVDMILSAHLDVYCTYTDARTSMPRSVPPAPAILSDVTAVLAARRLDVASPGGTISCCRLLTGRTASARPRSRSRSRSCFR